VGGSPLNWLARAVASVAVYVICLCTHGAVYRFWRTLPYTSLAVGLLYFGVFPQALTRRMTPAVAEIVKMAHAPAAPAKAAAPAPAVKPAK
jgi:hypothetical protein